MSKEESSLTRREFIGATAGATLLSAASAASAASTARIQGANDRVRIGLIGSGSRGRQVAGFFLKHPDAQYTAVADVFQNNVDAAVKAFEGSQAGVKVDTYGDYKRILERKDIDAVHIATPDHWHCRMVVEAIEAGKDVYVEKPLSNNVEEMVKALKAYRTATASCRWARSSVRDSTSRKPRRSSTRVSSARSTRRCAAIRAAATAAASSSRRSRRRVSTGTCSRGRPTSTPTPRAAIAAGAATGTTAAG